MELQCLCWGALVSAADDNNTADSPPIKLALIQRVNRDRGEGREGKGGGGGWGCREEFGRQAESQRDGKGTSQTGENKLFEKQASSIQASPTHGSILLGGGWWDMLSAAQKLFWEQFLLPWSCQSKELKPTNINQQIPSLVNYSSVYVSI